MDKSKALGYIIHRGASAIDGAPVVAIINRVHTRSRNKKTGHLVQSWILRADIEPHLAVKTGDDESICGSCPHRPLLAKATGAAPCYVRTYHAPLSVYRAYHRGRYETLPLDQVADVLAGRDVRIGSYGDPGAIPVDAWQTVTAKARSTRGYSHLWHDLPSDWSRLVMASVDSPAEQAQAQARGFRTFRVALDDVKASSELSCPASREAGVKTQCERCRLCSGTQVSAPSIVIQDHAAGWRERVAAA